MPHLARSLRMHGQFAQLNAEAQSLLECLDRLARGVVLLNRHGQVLRANRAAEHMAAQRDGLYLSSGTLKTSLAGESAALQKMIHDAARTASGNGLSSGGTAIISRPSGRRPWVAVVSPHRTASEDGLAAVLLIDPEEQPEPCVAVVSRLFGFTQSETRLALLLARGVRLEDAAVQLRITMNTARTHTRRMLDKANVRRQTDLVLLLNKLPTGRKL
jgi:DNA-binding CsgD family transcriptional regulator